LAETNGIVAHVRNHVKVVGHDDETAAEPTVTLWVVEQEGNETLEVVLIVEHARPAVHANGQQVGDVSIAVRPDTM
jgi:hypothetical protein